MSDAPKKQMPAFLRGITLKELTSTLIALMIVCLNIYIFWYLTRFDFDPFQAITDFLKKNPKITTLTGGQIIQLQDNLEAQRRGELKEVLTLSTGFLSLIIGYYFGRIPAERALESAENQVKTAQDAATIANEKTQAKDKELKFLAKSGLVMADTIDAQSGKKETFTTQSANDFKSMALAALES